jgi:hypothetical protein
MLAVPPPRLTLDPLGNIQSARAVAQASAMAARQKALFVEICMNVRSEMGGHAGVANGRCYRFANAIISAPRLRGLTVRLAGFDCASRQRRAATRSGMPAARRRIGGLFRGRLEAGG